MVKPELKYLFSNDFHPFDPHTEGVYFIICDGYSNLEIDINVFHKKNLLSRIPYGYKPITVCKRIVYIEKKEIIKVWPLDEIKSHAIEGKYVIVSPVAMPFFIPKWNQIGYFYRIPKEDSDIYSIEAKLYHSLEEAVNKAKDLSNTFIVSQVINYLKWS